MHAKIAIAFLIISMILHGCGRKQPEVIIDEVTSMMVDDVCISVVLSHAEIDPDWLNFPQSPNTDEIDSESFRWK